VAAIVVGRPVNEPVIGEAGNKKQADRSTNEKWTVSSSASIAGAIGVAYRQK
jgi:hypothetical protein